MTSQPTLRRLENSERSGVANGAPHATFTANPGLWFLGSTLIGNLEVCNCHLGRFERPPAMFASNSLAIGSMRRTK
jgi:hypothetical protein